MKLIAQAQAAHITAIILPAPAILAAVVVNARLVKCKIATAIVVQTSGWRTVIAMTAPTNGTMLRFT